MKYLPLILILLAVGILLIIFLPGLILAIGFVKEVKFKVANPVNKLLDDPNTIYPATFSTELNGYLIKQLCTLDRMSPQFGEVLDAALKLDDDVNGTITYEILESIVVVNVTIYGYKQESEMIN